MALRDPVAEATPWRLDPPDSLTEWPEVSFGHCDVPGCQGWMLRHLPLCREHAAFVELAILQDAHNAVEDWEGRGARRFPSLERYIREHATRAWELIG